MRHPTLRLLAVLVLVLQAATTLVRGQSLCIGLGSDREAVPHAHESTGLFHVHAHGREGRLGDGHSHCVDATADSDECCGGAEHADAACGAHVHVEFPEIDLDGRLSLGSDTLPSAAPLASSAPSVAEPLRLTSSLRRAGDLAWSACDARRAIDATLLRL